MIGMVAYAILGGFILIAVMISNRLVKIFGWSLSPNKLFLLRVGVFFGIFFVLFFDRIIGMIQFEYICYRKATVKLDPDWIKVQRAKFETKETKLWGYLVPTSCTDYKYQDIDSGKVFFSFTQCSRGGGILLKKISFNGSSGGASCVAKEMPSIFHAINVDALIEKGNSQ